MSDQGTTRARTLFEKELRRRQVSFECIDDGRYIVDVDGTRVTVSLDNLARDFMRDSDEGVIARFVERCLTVLDDPDWETAVDHVYFAAERFDHEFGDTFRRQVTDTVMRVLVVTDSGETGIRWIMPALQAKWNVTLDQLEDAARANLDKLLAGKKLDIAEAAGKKLGMISVDSALKASLIFAPGLRGVAEPELGWPILAVVPSRDFIYLISELDRELLNRLGTVVQREFRSSGYPITTEVLRISDDGIKAIGAFPE